MGVFKLDRNCWGMSSIQLHGNASRNDTSLLPSYDVTHPFAMLRNMPQVLLDVYLHGCLCILRRRVTGPALPESQQRQGGSRLEKPVHPVAHRHCHSCRNGHILCRRGAVRQRAALPVDCLKACCCCPPRLPPVVTANNLCTVSTCDR